MTLCLSLISFTWSLTQCLHPTSEGGASEELNSPCARGGGAVMAVQQDIFCSVAAGGGLGTVYPTVCHFQKLSLGQARPHPSTGLP